MGKVRRVVWLDKRDWKKNCRVESGGCWIWKPIQKAYAPNKYISFHRKIGGKGYGYVHRYAFVLFKGKIPSGKEIAHSCDCKHCVNPKHLTAITHRRNMLDAWRRNRVDRKETAQRMKLTTEKLWKSEAYRAKHAARMRKQWRENTDFRKRQRIGASRAQKLRWSKIKQRRKR